MHSKGLRFPEGLDWPICNHIANVQKQVGTRPRKANFVKTG